MTGDKPYTYTVLRYHHDVMTEEFVNVGVLVYFSNERHLAAKFRTTHGRLSAVFPDLDRKSFKQAMSSLKRAVARQAKSINKGALGLHQGDASTFARAMLPEDDSSIRWSPVGGGVSDSVEGTLKRLFERLVSRYDTTPDHRRPDADVWRPVQKMLADRQLDVPLEEKVIRGSDDEIEFKHAWKNGIWHCYEPLSFDLATADNIKDKARRWAGHLLGVADAKEKFRPYFVVGPPKDARLDQAYETALATLRKSPQGAIVFTEDKISKLVDLIENEVHAHERWPTNG